ncbi:MAG: glutaredoxin family protein [Mariprofundaceae bacterium]
MRVLPVVEVMSRHDCCLCVEAKDVVKRVAEDGMCHWREVDVDSNVNLVTCYGHDVPVILINGRKAFKHRLDEQALRLRLEREQLLTVGTR